MKLYNYINRFMLEVSSLCIYAILFGGIMYICDLDLTSEKSFPLAGLLGFFAGLLHNIGRTIEFFNRDMSEDRKKSAFSDTETVMKDLGRKMAVFSKATAGKSSDDILSEMRGEESPAWGEEDEKIYNRIYDLIHAAAFENCDVDEDGNELGEYAKIANWFKHLKNRYSWQPNEEQIKAVRLARSFVTDDFSDNPTLSEILTELEEQLKKLKG